MQTTIAARLFDRLADLIPSFATSGEGAVYYAPPRLEGDIASYCTVSKACGNGVFVLELSHDIVVKGVDEPAPWMEIRVDLNSRQAELLTVQDEWRYEVVYSESGAPNPKRTQLNLYAVNWLSMMLHHGGAFRPVDVPVAV